MLLSLKSQLCAYCGAHEDQGHLLLRCPRARRIWRLIGWPQAACIDSFRDLWDIHDLALIPYAKVRSGIVTAVLWKIWKYRNDLVFNNVLVPAHVTLRAVATDLDLVSEIRLLSPLFFRGSITFVIL